MGILVTENNTVIEVTESGARGPAGPAGGSYTVKAVTADVTAAVNDFIQADATAGPITVTLPTPTNGQNIIVMKTDASANVVTISGVGDIAYQNTTVHLYSDGTAWRPI